MQVNTTNAIEIIDVSEHKPRRIPSAQWRELIKKVWEADPLLCKVSGSPGGSPSRLRAERAKLLLSRDAARKPFLCTALASPSPRNFMLACLLKA